MHNLRLYFHWISYAQYLFMGISIYFYIIFFPGIVKLQPDWSILNTMLVFLGISISFSTLQDTRKTQNKVSLRVWQSPKKGAAFLLLMGIMTLVFMLTGLVGMTFRPETIIKEISLGLVVIGIGMMGQVKTASEMFEYHRQDSNDALT